MTFFLIILSLSLSLIRILVRCHAENEVVVQPFFATKERPEKICNVLILCVTKEGRISKWFWIWFLCVSWVHVIWWYWRFFNVKQYFSFLFLAQKCASLSSAEQYYLHCARAFSAVLSALWHSASYHLAELRTDGCCGTFLYIHRALHCSAFSKSRKTYSGPCYMDCRASANFCRISAVCIITLSNCVYLYFIIVPDQSGQRRLNIGPTRISSNTRLEWALPTFQDSLHV